MPRKTSALLLVLTVIAGGMTGCQPIRERRVPPSLTPPPHVELPYDRARRLRRQSASPLLIAGAAGGVITPPRKTGGYIGGFGPNRRATGVLDPIEARALYLADGQHSAVLVVLDTAGISNDWVWGLRQRLSRDVDMPLAVVATHDHAGPDLMGIWGPWLLWALPLRSGIDRIYQEWVSQRIVRLVDQAVSDARNARVVVAEAEAPARGLCYNERGEPESWDRTVGVIKLEDLDGGTVATLVNFGCHPETLWEQHTYLSADYPGVLRDRVEDALGGVAIFVPGALGAMVTADLPRDTPFSERLPFMRRLGADVAALAVQAIQENPDSTGQARVYYERETVSLPLNLFGARALLGLGIIDRPVRDDHILTEVNLLEIGNAQLLLVPGEVPPEVATEFKALMSAKHRYVVSTANDELGYVLNLKQCLDPVYEYEQSARVSADLYPVVKSAAQKLLAGK